MQHLKEPGLWLVFKAATWLWFATGWKWSKGPLGWSAGLLLRMDGATP